ncbi:ATP-binding protein [Actinocorallia lasiicapitis]
MLLSFRTANHKSLRDEQQLLLTPVYPPESADEGEWEALPVAGIFGPNASGKSNVLDALVYMRHMVRASLQASEPGTPPSRTPHALDREAIQAPSSYVVDLLLDGVRHEYGFSVGPERIDEEWLYSYPLKQRRRIFHRTGDAYEWGTHTEAAMRSVAAIVDPSVLFISVAARSRQDDVEPVYDWFYRKLASRRLVGGVSQRDLLARLAKADETYLTWLNGLLRAADTGIEDAEVTDVDEVKLSDGFLGNAGQPRRVQFNHRGGDGTVPFKIADESTGTQSLMSLASPIFSVLNEGGTLVVDELDASLHPYLSARLIGLFRSAVTNQNGAQLLFTTHDAALLGRIQGVEVLARDQIWFTEKDECGRTELFPLTEFKPRKDENRELRYLAGRYGAVPALTDELVLTTLAQRGAEDVVPKDA